MAICVHGEVAYFWCRPLTEFAGLLEPGSPATDARGLGAWSGCIVGMVSGSIMRDRLRAAITGMVLSLIATGVGVNEAPVGVSVAQYRVPNIGYEWWLFIVAKKDVGQNNGKVNMIKHRSSLLLDEEKQPVNLSSLNRFRLPGFSRTYCGVIHDVGQKHDSQGPVIISTFGTGAKPGALDHAAPIKKLGIIANTTHKIDWRSLGLNQLLAPTKDEVASLFGGGGRAANARIPPPMVVLQPMVRQNQRNKQSVVESDAGGKQRLSGNPPPLPPTMAPQGKWQ